MVEGGLETNIQEPQIFTLPSGQQVGAGGRGRGGDGAAPGVGGRRCAALPSLSFPPALHPFCPGLRTRLASALVAPRRRSLVAPQTNQGASALPQRGIFPSPATRRWRRSAWRRLTWR